MTVPLTPDTLAYDVSCDHCNYNLRGLAVDSRCPECGRSIADSLRAGPVTRWSRPFRRGVLALAVALAVLPFVEPWVYRRFTWGVNRDGVVYLAHALLVLPAAWWLTTPAPFLRPDPRRLRPWLLSLAVTQAAMAVAVELLWRRFSWAGNAVLLSTYALAPLVHVAMVALLLEVPARPMRARVITRPLPRPVYRLAQWLLVYSLLSPAIVTAVVNFVRIGYLNAPPPRDNYLPAPWDTLLNNLFSTPGYRIQGVALVAAALVVLHTWHRLTHGPVALPDSNRDRPDPALVSRSGP